MRIFIVIFSITRDKQICRKNGRKKKKSGTNICIVVLYYLPIHSHAWIKFYPVKKQSAEHL